MKKEIILGTVFILSVVLYKYVEFFKHPLFLILLLLVSQILILYWDIKDFPKGLEKFQVVLRVFFIQNKLTWYTAIVFFVLNYPGCDTFMLSAVGTLILLLIIGLAMKCKKSYLLHMLSYLIIGSTFLYILSL